MYERMKRVCEKLWRKLKDAPHRPAAGWLYVGESGQSLILVMLVLMVLLAFVGLGVDLGIFYVQRVRASQAADAAALAAAPELPAADAAHQRALVYLQVNGYDYQAADTEWARDEYQGEGEYGHDPGGMTTIWTDTEFAEEERGEKNSANRIRVRVRRKVPTYFMQLVFPEAFKYLSVEASAEAENVTHIDAAIVYDKSSSMEFQTLCYGCWEPEAGMQYPSGRIAPLHWSDTTIESADHCADDCTTYVTRTIGSIDYQVSDCYYYNPLPAREDYYIVIEAEHYSYHNIDYHRPFYQPYKSYWIVQRNTYNEDEGEDVGAFGEAYISHHPYVDEYMKEGGLGISCTWSDLDNGEICRREWPDGTNVPTGRRYETPRVDYDFQVPETGNYYIWIRGQGGAYEPRDEYEGTFYTFWGIDGEPKGKEDDFPEGPVLDGAMESKWDWRCLGRGEDGFTDGTEELSAGQHTLNIWAGGAGFDVDRIIITTDNRGCAGDYDPPDNVENFDANKGRTGSACEPCDSRFAGRPGGQTSPAYRPDCGDDRRYDDIYDDEQPIRDALEAAKYFVKQLDPRFDQVGYVPYSSSAEIAEELQCLRRLGAGACSPQVITDTVIAALDNTQAEGGTNIADGILTGIEVLSSEEGHYGRSGAAHIMVLMTDGRSNASPSGPCDDDPDLWPYDDESANDCVIYYAHEARDNFIKIYTITLGWGADEAIMAEVADITGGTHFHAERSEQLEEIFGEIYERMFVRLVR